MTTGCWSVMTGGEAGLEAGASCLVVTTHTSRDCCLGFGLTTQTSLAEAGQAKTRAMKRYRIRLPP